MIKVDPRAFEFALIQIKDDYIFERFAQDLLCQRLGHTFVPVGGVKDRGIDGLNHCFGVRNIFGENVGRKQPPKI